LTVAIKYINSASLTDDQLTMATADWLMELSHVTR